MRRFVVSSSVLLFVQLSLAAVALAQVLPVATRTVFLDASSYQMSVPSSVAFHPGFQQYYGASSGSPDRPAATYTSDGGAPIDVQDPINVDVRALNYNANTDLIEVVSFNAMSGGADRGLIDAQLDGSGVFNGMTATLLASMPGLPGSQATPAYDAAADVFYARVSGSTVNVVRRSDGGLDSTIELDFATAGNPSAGSEGVAFDPVRNWLGVIDQNNDRFVFFNLSGAFIGATQLDITLTSDSRRPSIANGNLFVYDSAREGWQGYEFAGGVSPLQVPTVGVSGLALLSLLLGLAALVVIRRAA